MSCVVPNYSIIIPHKDIPDLLQRCLDAIPVRDDVEVIVVDDNSDPRKVDFAHFPQWKGKQYQYFLTKEGKGAGYARNVGLEHAEGRWIVFADADDFFAEDFNSLLDEMIDVEEDLIFFDYVNVLSDDITKQVEERTKYRKRIHSFLEGDKSEKKLRMSMPCVWAKLVRRELIENRHLRFSEVMWGEDVYFSVQTGCFAKAIRVSDKIGYVVTSRRGSTTDNFCATAKEYRVRVSEALKCDALLKAQYGSRARSRGLLKYIYRTKGFGRCAWFCAASIFNPRVFWRTAGFLYRRIRQGDVKYTKIENAA